MQKIKLSIIIVNFNTGNFLSRCLKSIYKADLPKVNFEIIVVDNNSTDESIFLIKKKHPKVTFIQNKKNIGFAAANNQGIAEAKGDFILILNPDTLIREDTLKQLIDFLEKNPDVGIVTSKVELTSGKIDDACHRGFPTPWRAFCHFSGLAGLFPGSQFFNGYHLGYQNLDKIHEIESCTGAFMLVKAEAGRKVGWFDEDYFWYGEDLDFCFKIKSLGWKIIYYPYVTTIHYKGVSGGIKKHSSHLSYASKETQLLATKARFEVMRIFYEKHYADRYPSWLKKAIFWGIGLKEYFNLIKYR